MGPSRAWAAVLRLAFSRQDRGIGLADRDARLMFGREPILFRTELIQLGRKRLRSVMNDDEVPAATAAAIARQVSAFYENHPYPPPVDDLQAYRQALGRPAPTRRLASLLAGRTVSRRPQHTGGRLRHHPGRPLCAALAPRAGHRDRRQRQEHRVHARAEAQARARQPRGAPARRWSAPPNSASASSTWSAPACCTICPTPMPGCGPCTTCSSRMAPSM